MTKEKSSDLTAREVKGKSMKITMIIGGVATVASIIGSELAEFLVPKIFHFQPGSIEHVVAFLAIAMGIAVPLTLMFVGFIGTRFYGLTWRQVFASGDSPEPQDIGPALAALRARQRRQPLNELWSASRTTDNGTTS